MALTPQEEGESEDSLSASEDTSRGKSKSDHPLTFADMSVFAADIKATFSAAITDLKTSMMVINEKMAAAENAGRQRDKAIHKLELVSSNHMQHFINMNRHIEDLDNRGRRCNVRVRGIPESVDQDQITTALRRVFNSLLERQEDTEINFVRAHRALRPRGSDTAPPRDIICCLQSFATKEEIMRKVRQNEQIIFNGATIMLFQDLSQITLKNRRALRPLLEKLRAKDLRYTWRFPFALTVTYNGRQAILRSPADLPEFCEALDLEPMDLPEWYEEILQPPLIRSPPTSPLSSPDKRLSKKHKQNKGNSSHADTPRRLSGPSRAQECE